MSMPSAPAIPKAPAIDDNDRWGAWLNDLETTVGPSLTAGLFPVTTSAIPISGGTVWAIDADDIAIAENADADQEDDNAAPFALHDFRVPKGEHVRIPGLFVAELFPPSQADELVRAIKRHNWNLLSLGVRVRADERILREARSGTGWHCQVGEPGR